MSRNKQNYQLIIIRYPQIRTLFLLLNLFIQKKMENKCDDCGKIFGSAYALKRHQSLHRGDAKTYTCPICSKTFNRNYNLTRHLNLHTQEQKFLCDICYRPFNDYSCVKKHRLSHFPPSQYTCEYCQQKFNRRGNLRVHLVSKHLGNKRTWKDVVDSGQVGDDDELKPAVKYVKKEQNSVVNEEIGNTVTGERKHGHDAGPYNEQESDSGFRNIKSIDREKDETVHLLEDNEIKVELAEESGEEMSTDDQAEKSSTYSMDCFVATTNHSTYDQAEKSRTYSVDSLVTTTDHSAEGEIKIRLVNGKAFNEDVSCWQCALCDKVLSCKSHLDTHMERCVVDDNR